VGIDSLDGGAGNDTFTVGTTSGEFTGLTTAETVIGGAGNDTLSFAAGAFTVNNTDLNLSSIETIEFLATTANVSLTMTDAVMAANGNATVTIDADTITSGALTIAAGSLTSAYSLVVDLDTTSLAGDGSHSITLGAGNDTVIMELDDLTTNASLTVAGGSGSDTLQITDAGDASAAGSEITLDDGVAGFETIRPKFFNPINAKNKPMPQDIACFILLGRHSTIFCRIGKIETTINKILDQKYGKLVKPEIKSGKKLVLFYADWCGHCKKIKPVWDEAADHVNKDDVKMIKVNCGEGSEEDKKIMKKYNIDGYPTIIKFVDGTPSLYRGDRDANSFKEVFN
jgi:thiol-disulfide isomerase/thioredoxin/Ca2+-binding RTX toxin-like protein